MPPTLDVCLSIAGSDPSGGAGIQADLKTFATLNVYGCAAITCLTAQNSQKVMSYQTVDGSFLYEQIRLVLDDLPLTHIKIGMVGDKEIAHAIGKALHDFHGHITYDPVLKASDGNSLSRADALGHIQEHVIKKATVITPNLPELEILTNSSCQNSQRAIEQAAQLLNNYPKLEAVVLTGGHFPEELKEDPDLVTDYLVLKNKKPSGSGQQVEKACHQRIETSNTHGTGCTFSSAFAAYHLKYGDHRKAFKKASAFMEQLITISTPYNTGKGHGGLVHHLLRDPN